MSDDGFLETRRSIFNVSGFDEYNNKVKFPKREVLTYRYIYPDSVWNKTIKIHNKFDKAQNQYIETYREIEVNELHSYIPPIDTVSVDLGINLKGSYTPKVLIESNVPIQSIVIFTEKLIFIDSLNYKVVYPPRSSCSSSSQAIIFGKYQLISDTLRMFLQSSSLLIDTTVFFKTVNEELVLISKNKSFSKKYYKLKD